LEELGVGIVNVLIPHLAVPVAGKQFFVIPIQGDVFPPGITGIDQVALIAKQEGVKKVFLHNLFKRPVLYNNNIFSASTIVVNINLERNWHRVGWGTRMLICHSLD
jgi:hypothetical protein